VNRNAIEVGAFTWTRIQSFYDADVDVHWQRCESKGLRCPLGVFAQIFHETEEMLFVPAESADVRPGGRMLSDLNSVAAIDWGRIRWELTELSGVAVRHMHVDRKFRFALDEARDHAVCYGIVDEREEVERHWRDARSWLVPPVAVSADLLGGDGGLELLVGFTRLGNVLGMLDRQKVPEANTHLVWVGRHS
jgi:hypothetical protein